MRGPEFLRIRTRDNGAPGRGGTETLTDLDHVFPEGCRADG